MGSGAGGAQGWGGVRAWWGRTHLPEAVAGHDGGQRVGDVGRVPKHGGALLQGLEDEVQLAQVSLEERGETGTGGVREGARAAGRNAPRGSGEEYRELACQKAFSR